MKNFKSKLIYIFVLAAAMQSCVNDLDVTPTDDDVFLSEAFFAQPGAYKQGLAGVYGNLSLTGPTGATSSFLQGIDGGTSQFGRCLWYFQELTTDEVVWSYENDEGTRELNRNTWTPQNPLLLGMFSRTMAEVSLANEYLRQTTPEKLSARGVSDATLLADIELYRKEVRVLRAYAYYTLMDLFGKAPFLTETDPLNFRGPEYNRQQLFDFVELELLTVMPDLKAPRANEYGRLDQAVAKMILAKMYLNAEVYINNATYYDECVAMCSDVIAGGYTLESNYLDNFKADNNTSTEMIFTLQSDGNVTQNYGATTVMINGQIGEWENNGTAFGVGGWGGALRVRKQFAQKWDGAQFDFDARKTLGTGIAGDPTKQRPIDIADITRKTQGYIISKYSNISSTGVPGPNSTFVNTDFPLFRLADAYLMYAEATVRGGNGDPAQALAYINALRERANGNQTANISAPDMTLDFILDERSRELHWEAHRRQDLIRFGKYTGGSYNWAWKGNAANGIALPTHFKVFPLPQASIDANPNLTQNTGY